MALPSSPWAAFPPDLAHLQQSVPHYRGSHACRGLRCGPLCGYPGPVQCGVAGPGDLEPQAPHGPSRSAHEPRGAPPRNRHARSRCMVSHLSWRMWVGYAGVRALGQLAVVREGGRSPRPDRRGGALSACDLFRGAAGLRPVLRGLRGHVGVRPCRRGAFLMRIQGKEVVRLSQSHCCDFLRATVGRERSCGSCLQ